MYLTDLNAARDWLIGSDPDPGHARRWLGQARMVLLPLGYRWSAVKVPDQLGQAVAAGISGPVIRDPGWCFYFLVPNDAFPTWELARTEWLGEGNWLTVPVPTVTEPPGPHWIHLPHGSLVDPHELHTALTAEDAT